ncbi:MAG: pyridoxal phosphate-dependent aminotransferase [Anaerolineales bacterium]|jgi:aspartate/methionine/tyrosine aminotransferase
MFTDRVNSLQAEGAYAVLAHAQALEAQGRKILHLEIGQPDFPTFPNVSQAGIEAIKQGQTRYTSPGGMPALRAAIAGFVSRQLGLNIGPECVVVGPGAKPGLFFPTLALVNPGDEVLYPDPGFPTYPAMIRVAGGIPVPVPLREENQFSFDLHAFDARISDKTRLIVLNSPANPTGGVIPLNDLKHVAEKVREHDTWIMSDEIYARLVYDGLRVPSITALPGMLERTIIVDGFSKTYAMTGWRLGYMVMPETLAERVELLLTHSIGCTATFTQIAGVEALTGPQEKVAENVAEYQRRRDYIVSGLNAIPGVSCQVPQGAFYVFPNVKSFGISSKEIARRMIDEAGVAVLAGSDFGSGGEGYLRLCYATSLQVLQESLEKMAAWFKLL